MIRQSAFTLGFAAALMTAAWNKAAADVALQGSFTAAKVCPALQSIRKATNPGNVELVVGRAYDVLAQNAQVPTHYRIRIQGAEPPERWVSIDCGAYQNAAAANGLPNGGGTDQAAGTRTADAVLALSWEPSFCAGHANKPECAKETAGSFDATHFSLHGLWPQPQGREYCNVARPLVEADKKGDWAALPAVDLSAATRDRLNREMPGTQSFLAGC
jgi:ribonuclease T2